MVPETYCHTLSEAWSCGIPVLASKMGALEERINKNKGGWFLDIDNPYDAYNEIIRISENKEEYLKIMKHASEIKLKSIQEMGDEYKNIYNKLLIKPQSME